MNKVDAGVGYVRFLWSVVGIICQIGCEWESPSECGVSGPVEIM